MISIYKTFIIKFNKYSKKWLINILKIKVLL